MRFKVTYFFSYDCDEFTKSFLRDNYGINDFTPLVLEEENKPKPRTAVNIETILRTYYFIRIIKIMGILETARQLRKISEKCLIMIEKY